MWSTILIICFIPTIICAIGSELENTITVQQCTERRLQFGCADGDVVITEAWLYDALLKVRPYHCHIPDFKYHYKKGSILRHINKKCAGQSKCDFTMIDDVPGAKADKKFWLKGVLRVMYVCVPNNDVFRTCGETVHRQFGWLESVSYPNYYLGPENCTLTIAVDEGQTIKATIVDLNIRGLQPTHLLLSNRSTLFKYTEITETEENCEDYLTISEGLNLMDKRCGDINKPLLFTSESNQLNITLVTHFDIVPKRGFLAYFQAIGCETPPFPVNGYLYRRDSLHAEFACDTRFVFSDNFQRRRKIECIQQSNWNDSVPDCIDLDFLLEDGNITMTEYQYLYNGTTSATRFTASLIIDLVIPAVIMGILVIGNVAVVILIIYCRRRINYESGSSDELESIKANPEPTAMSDPAPYHV